MNDPKDASGDPGARGPAGSPYAGGPGPSSETPGGDPTAAAPAPQVHYVVHVHVFWPWGQGLPPGFPSPWWPGAAASPFPGWSAAAPFPGAAAAPFPGFAAAAPFPGASAAAAPFPGSTEGTPFPGEAPKQGDDD